MTYFNKDFRRTPIPKVGERYRIVDEHHTCYQRIVVPGQSLFDGLVVCEVLTYDPKSMLIHREDYKPVDVTHLGALLILHQNQIEIENKPSK